MSFLLVAQRALTVPGWVQNALWRAAKATPSLDLPFADSKSLVDAITGRQLISYARAGSGAYTDSAGVLSTATTNLLLRSEEFDNAAWTTLALNATVSANQTTAPNGATTADSIADDAVNNVHYIGQSVAVAAATTYTFSCFLRAGTSNFGYLSLSGGGPGWGDTFVVNLSTGVGNVQAGSFGSTSIQAFANGWYRVVVTKITTGSGSPQLRIGVAQSLSVTSYSGSGSTIFAWGAQLEQSSTVGEYIPTGSTINSAPRFDHNPLTGESLGLLVEEQRTNLMGNSGVLTAAPNWQAVGATLAVSGTAPDSNSAYEATENTGTSTHTFNNGGTAGSTSTSVTSGTIYTGSIFLKKSTEDWVQLTFGGNGFGSSLFINFNLATGSTGNSAGCTGTITPFRDGWYRCTITATATTTALSNNLIVAFTNNTNTTSRIPSYTGSTAHKFFAALGQFEAGATASSYIPTTTAAATRNADVVSITGTAFTSFYNQSEGTVFSAFSIPTSSTTGGARVYSISNSGATTQAWLRLQGGTNRVYEVTDSSTQQAVLSAGTFSAGVLYRGAVALKTNDFGFSENGSTPTVDNSGTLGTVDRMGIGMDASGTAPLNGHIRRLTYWPKALPGQLQAITQP